jgi:hypothetical protein
MSQRVVLVTPSCDVLPGLVVTGVVTGGVVVAGVVVTGVVACDEDELDPVPPDPPLLPVLADADGDADGDELVGLAVEVVLVAGVVLVVAVFAPAVSNGSRVRLVGAGRGVEDACDLWVTGDGVVDVPPGAGGAAMSALARWPCRTNGTATIAAMITTASGQRRRSMRSRFRELILWPPCWRPSRRPRADRCLR